MDSFYNSQWYSVLKQEVQGCGAAECRQPDAERRQPDAELLRVGSRPALPALSSEPLLVHRCL